VLIILEAVLVRLLHARLPTFVMMFVHDAIVSITLAAVFVTYAHARFPSPSPSITVAQEVNAAVTCIDERPPT